MRHTDRGVASTGVAGGGVTPGGGGYPSRGTPPPGHGWGTPAWTWMGYPPHLDMDGVPPAWTWMGYPPPPGHGWGAPPPISWMGYPPPPCGQAHKLKILPPLVLRTRSVIIDMVLFQIRT